MTATSVPESPTFADPIDPKIMECPYPFFEQLRREEPVHWVKSANYFLVSRFADVQDVLRRHEVFSSDISHLFEGQGDAFIPAKVLNLSDPPIHAQTKPLAVRAFSPARVNALGAGITAIVDDLIDKFIARGEVELLSQFAQPLPMTVIAGQLGVPVRDIDRLRHWSDEMLVFNNPSATAADRQRATQSIAEANEYLMAVLQAKRAQPTDDVISTLATASTEPVPGIPPRPLTDPETLSMIQLLLVGGNETTTNAIANGMLLLMRNPKVLDMLRAGKADWETTIEEFLRLESPVRGFWRLALRDTEVAGVPIAKGNLVFLSFSSANRDPEHFPDAQCLDPGRANARTHLAFGQGIHMCVGFRLARKELNIAFPRLFARLTNIRLTPGKNDLDNMFVPTALVRGLKTLHLSFDAAGE
jgi:cytochrome P450